MSISPHTLWFLLPEAILLAVASLVIVGGTFFRGRGLWLTLSAGAFALAGIVFLQQADGPNLRLPAAEPLLWDHLGQTMRAATLALGFLFVLMLAHSGDTTQSGELFGLLILMFLGLLVVCQAGDLILLFLGLELISIPTYVMLFLGRRGNRGGEATLKYFFLSIVASALFLLGASLLFGATGTINLSQLAEPLAAVAAQPSATPVLWLMTVLLLAGLGFKVAAVPFHFYAPDVYEATTNGNAGLLAVVPKIGGMVALVRIATAWWPAAPDFSWQLVVVVSLLTMTLGNVCALWQDHIRRMMAYSSIAHAGYMLIGLAVGLAWGEAAGGQEAVYGGFSAALLYLLIYSAASAGTFAVLCELGGDRTGDEVQHLRQLAGLSRRRPGMAAVLAICMFSLAGIPPLAGFWGKFTLFSGAVSAVGAEGTGGRSEWFLLLTLAGLLNAATAAAYYLRVVSMTYFADRGDLPGSTRSGTARPVGVASVSAFLCAAFLVLVGCFPKTIVGQFAPITAPAAAAIMSRAPSPSAVGVHAARVGPTVGPSGAAATDR